MPKSKKSSSYSLFLKNTLKQYLSSLNKTTSLGGKKEDIAGISLNLSEGDIKSPLYLENCPRKAQIFSALSFHKHSEKEYTKTFISEFWNTCLEDLEKIKSNPSQIRIWLDKTPDAQCGLLFIADLLKDSKTEIHYVALPDDTCIISHIIGSVLGRQQLPVSDVFVAKRIQSFINSGELKIVENGKDGFYRTVVSRTK